ncbi:MAG: hypothetical protein ACI4VK_00475 [Candidatus Coproplasma sp.]
MAEYNRENECKTYLRIVAEERYLDDIMGCISKFTPCKREKNSVVAGVCDSYDIDVNAMLKQSLASFVGREQTLLDIQQKYSAEIWLVVVPQIVADSDKPRQLLSPDEWVIEFLYKAGVKYDLDYYIV